jgi:hypothetical protein
MLQWFRSVHFETVFVSNFRVPEWRTQLRNCVFSSLLLYQAYSDLIHLTTGNPLKGTSIRTCQHLSTYYKDNLTIYYLCSYNLIIRHSESCRVVSFLYSLYSSLFSKISHDCSFLIPLWPPFITNLSPFSMLRNRFKRRRLRCVDSLLCYIMRNFVI